jgi:hypothetical protein
LVLLACVAVGYSVAYFWHPLFPGFGASDPARGWLTWTDQSRYLVESRAIARLQLDATSYFYPWGYPLLGAIFVKWMPSNPFFIPDLIFILAATHVWWRLANRWLNPTAALTVAAVFLFTHSWMVRQTMVVPWNTIPTQFSLLAGIGIVLGKPDARAVWWLAILTAFTYFVRPIDAVAFAPLLVFATLRLSTWRARIRSGLAGLGIVASAVLAVGCFNLWLLGQWRTAYEIVSTQAVGFFSYPVSYKIFWLFVDGQPLFNETDLALLFRYPWLFLGIPALLFLVKQERWAGIAVLSVISLNGLLYVNYNDLLPSDIYRFMLIHYLAWIFPLVFLLAAAACLRARRCRWAQVGLGLAVGAVVLCVGLRLEPGKLETFATGIGVYALPTTRPLLIEFPGASMESIAELRIDGRPLVEYSEYVAPYVPSDLKLLLGTKTHGSNIGVAPGARLTAPLVSEYRWRWKPMRERLNIFAERKNY